MSKRQPEGAVQPAPHAEPVAGSPTLTGKVVLVTGASRGIGRAIALACAEAGADVVVTYRTSQQGTTALAAAVQDRGRRAHVIQADTADPKDIKRLARDAHATFGRVDAWINNAGADILTGSGASRPRLDKLDLLLAVDLRGTILASWAAVDLMRQQPGGGVILNVAWDHVLGGMKGDYAQLFCAAKGGVYSFSRALALSVAPHVRVNVLGPGWIETAYGADLDPALKQRITASIPLGRWGTPEDVAHTAVYLASDAASYITGQMLMINGGAVV